MSDATELMRFMKLDDDQQADAYLALLRKVEIYEQWAQSMRRCQQADWCAEEGECWLQDGPRPLWIGKHSSMDDDGVIENLQERNLDLNVKNASLLHWQERALAVLRLFAERDPDDDEVRNLITDAAEGGEE